MTSIHESESCPNAKKIIIKNGKKKKKDKMMYESNFWSCGKKKLKGDLVNWKCEYQEESMGW